MFGSLKKIFGTANDRRLKSAQAKVAGINALEPQFEALTDEELAGKTMEFRERYQNGESLDKLLPEAFAAVREAAKRALDMRPFDVQLVGGMILHQGGIAEMKTGEGKTLVATLPVYLNALCGRGVHVVTVNDYLASRDSEWMGAVYRKLGMSVGCIVHGLSDEERRTAYAADVTYATNNELGFDYLRDNTKFSTDEMVQRDHHFAIVDEVDSILIDEARTPLILSGPAEDSSELYRAIDQIIPKLDESTYEKDEKQRTIAFTEEGNEAVEAYAEEMGLLNGLSLYAPESISVLHHLNQALRAHKLFTRDKDYMVRGGQVVIIDEFTGRAMEGRRYSEGLHQALEAKENVDIQPESSTFASITYQNYFRLYEKLAGMTGTALTEEAEFEEIYKLRVVEIPTNLPIARADKDDEVYRTQREKYDAIIADIELSREKGQPVLVGTTSIENSELLANALIEKGYRIKSYTDPDAFKPLYDGDQGSAAEKVFAVLNARYHEQEAQIVAQAGVPGAITIATNMAGRGTDIKLGGSDEMRIEYELGEMPEGAERTQKEAAIRVEVAALKEKALAAGGLYVIGTERHESRRIDNQLRGRSGRQGDPGRSKFFLALDDDLMRIFGSERMDSMLQKLGLEEGEAISHPWVNKAVERAQGKVEARNFDIRKNILKYDDVVNDQRKAIFEQRREIMHADDVEELARDMRHQLVDDLVSTYIPEKAYADQWDVEGLARELKDYFGREFPVAEWAAEEGIADEEIREKLYEATDLLASEKAVIVGESTMRTHEKAVVLGGIDREWREHLSRLDHLRQVIGLRGFAQKDPLNEYKSEAFVLFDALLSRLRGAATRSLMHIDEMIEHQRQQYTMMFLQSEEGQRHIEAQVAEKGVSAEGEVQISVETPFGPQNVTLRADPEQMAAQQQQQAALRTHAEAAPARQRFDDNGAAVNADGSTPDATLFKNVGRNDPCPCGSGKKFKKCHGMLG